MNDNSHLAEDHELFGIYIGEPYDEELYVEGMDVEMMMMMADYGRPLELLEKWSWLCDKYGWKHKSEKPKITVRPRQNLNLLRERKTKGVKAIHMLQADAFERLSRGLLICSGEEAIEMAAARLQILYGDVNEVFLSNKGCLRDVWKSIMPLELKDRLIKADKIRDLEERVINEYKAQTGRAKKIVELLYLLRARRSPTYGAATYHVDITLKKKRRHCMLAVAETGLHFLDAEAHAILLTVPYVKLQGWRPLSNVLELLLEGDENMELETHVAEVICRVMETTCKKLLDREMEIQEDIARESANEGITITASILALQNLLALSDGTPRSPYTTENLAGINIPVQVRTPTLSDGSPESPTPVASALRFSLVGPVEGDPMNSKNMPPRPRQRGMSMSKIQLDAALKASREPVKQEQIVRREMELEDGERAARSHQLVRYAVVMVTT